MSGERLSGSSCEAETPVGATAARGAHPLDEAAERLLDAYSRGYFPMADSGTGEIALFTADPRALIPLEPGAMRVSRSLRKRVRSGRFRVTSDVAFGAVVRGCAAARPKRESTWISPELAALCVRLHELGHAHSIEAWLPAERARSGGGGEGGEVVSVELGGEGKPGDPRFWGAGTYVLVGGLYGACTPGGFIAESKFSRPELGGTDASKVVLVHLAHHLHVRGFSLLDVQFWNPHTDQFGLEEVTHKEFLRRLHAARGTPASWGTFEPWGAVEKLREGGNGG